jgi:methionyl-tRNA formyltransferase
LAAAGLERIREVAEIALVIADKHDNGVDTWRQSLVGRALTLGYVSGETLLQPGNPNRQDVAAAIDAVKPDIILSLQCRHIIRKELFSRPSIGTFNLHNAPLPLLRGCDPFSWAIHDGLQIMGVSLHQILDEGVDNGPVAAQRLWRIGAEDTAWSLYGRALEEALSLLTDTLKGPLPVPVPQDERFCTYHPMGQFDFSGQQVDWTMVADTLSAWIRARIFPPMQLPHFFAGTKKYEIVKCSKTVSQGVPGTVLSLDPLVISAKWGGIELKALRKDGEPIAPASLVKEHGLQIGSKLM